MIVWLASYPRSGNTFLRLLLFHGFGVKTYSEYNDPLIDQLDMGGAVGHAILPGPLADLAAAPELYFVKTHGMPVDRYPAVYLVRDGRDAVVSHAHFLCSFMRQKGWRGQLERWLGMPNYTRLLRQVIAGHRRLDRWRYGGWSQNVLAWTGRADGPTLVVRYEELVAQPEFWLSKVAEMFRVQARATEPAAVPDFATLHERWPQFFRKGRTGAWKGDMSPELESLFWHHHGEGMRALGYV